MCCTGRPDHGRTACASIGLDSGPPSPLSLEPSFWRREAVKYFEDRGYEVPGEHPVDGNDTIDVPAKRPGERLSVEIETRRNGNERN